MVAACVHAVLEPAAEAAPSPTSDSPSTLPVTTAADAANAASLEPPSLCARAEAYRWREPLRDPGAVLQAAEDATGLRRLTGRERGCCWPTPSGAWALGVPTADELRRVHHFDAHGHVESAPLRLTAQSLPPSPVWEPPVLFDFDGDGEAEIFFASRNGYDDMGCSEAEGASALLTFRDGTVTWFGPYRDHEYLRSDLVIMRDVDSDGRPDLVVTRLVNDDRGCRECSSTWGTPELVGHSKVDGTFDFGDAVARQALLRWCSSPPRKYLTPEAVLCARAWGESPETLRKKISASASPFDCARAEKRMSQAKPNANIDWPLLIAVATMPLPPSLRQAKGKTP